MYVVRHFLFCENHFALLFSRNRPFVQKADSLSIARVPLFRTIETDSYHFLCFFPNTRLNVILGTQIAWNVEILIDFVSLNFSTLFQITAAAVRRRRKKHNTTVYHMQTNTFAHALIGRECISMKNESQQHSTIEQMVSHFTLCSCVLVCTLRLEWTLRIAVLVCCSNENWQAALSCHCTYESCCVSRAQCTLRSRQYVTLEFIYSLTYTYLPKRSRNSQRIFIIITMIIIFSFFLCRRCVVFALLFFCWSPIHSHNTYGCSNMIKVTVFVYEAFVPNDSSIPLVVVFAAASAALSLLLFTLLSQRWLWSNSTVSAWWTEK